jgi:hypothetical protein
VSLCNPACAAGERCSAQGECEREAAAEPDDSEPERPRSHTNDADADKAPNPILRQPGSWVFAGRAGFQMVGGGHVESGCNTVGTQLDCQRETRADDDDKSLVMLGLDAMIHAAPGLRLGVGYQLVPYSSVKGTGEGKEVHLGHEHALNAIIEGLLPLGRRLALALRAQGGVHTLVIGGDLGKSGDEFLNDCHDSNAVHCEVEQGPLFGPSYGAMLGIVGGSAVRWRVDLALDRFSMKLPSSQMVIVEGESTSINSTLYGTRSWVLGGVEL